MNVSDRVSASWVLVVGSVALAYWFYRLPKEQREKLFGKATDDKGLPGGSSSVGELRLREAAPSRSSLKPFQGVTEFRWPSIIEDAFMKAIRKGKMKKIPGALEPPPGINPTGWYDPET